MDNTKKYNKASSLNVVSVMLKTFLLACPFALVSIDGSLTILNQQLKKLQEG